MENRVRNMANGVNGRVEDLVSSTMPDRLVVGTQAGTGRHHTTGSAFISEKRMIWSRYDNIIAMVCYLLFESDRKGCIRRMLDMWIYCGMLNVTDKRLAYQIRVIRRSTLLTDVEIEEIKNRGSRATAMGEIIEDTSAKTGVDENVTSELT